MLQHNEKQTTLLEFFAESLKVFIWAGNLDKNGPVAVKKSGTFKEKNLLDKSKFRNILP